MPRAVTRSQLSSLPPTAAALSGPRRVEEPTTTSSGTRPYQALYDESNDGIVELRRDQRSRTPSQRGQLLIEDNDAGKARRAKRQQTQLHSAGRRSKGTGRGAGKGKGGGKGKGKRRAASQSSQGFTTDGDDDADFDGDETDLGDSGRPIDLDSDDDGSVVVPTSDPRELETVGETYADELEDPEFRTSLSNELKRLLGDEIGQPTRKDLKAALKLARRGGTQEAPSQAAQQHAQAEELHLDGRNRSQVDIGPMPGAKRPLVTAPATASKRSRLDRSSTATTILDPSRSPTPPALGNKLTRAKPLGLPATAAHLGTRGPSAGLPPTAALPTPGQSQPLVPGSQALALAQSPSPLPAGFRYGLDADLAGTQTVPEDTQTVPEDTQTIPEDTQTVPEDTAAEPPQTTPLLPPGSASRGRASLSARPALTVAPSSSPELATPPGIAATRRTAALPSLSQRASQTRPATAAPTAPLALAGLSTRGSQTSHAREIEARENERRSEQLDRNERNRLRAEALYRRDCEQGHSPQDGDDFLEENEVERREQRNIANGRPTKRKRKAGIKCQPGRPSDAARLAVADVTAFSFAVGPYVTRQSGLILSIESYQRSFATLFPGRPYEEASADLIGAICDRLPGGRTVVKKNIRAIIRVAYGFKDDPVAQADIDHNLKLYKAIREDFHFKSLTDRRSHYEHPALGKSFVAGFFEAKHSPCAVFHTYFNPVRVETFATLLTMMESCIAEWRTGFEIKEHLNSKDQSIMYEKHILNLEVFAAGAPKRYTDMCLDFYAAGCRKAVRGADPEVSIVPTVRREDIRPDTPSPSPSPSASRAASPSRGASASRADSPSRIPSCSRVATPAIPPSSVPE